MFAIVKKYITFTKSKRHKIKLIKKIIMKKEIYPKYITKVNIKPKYTVGENILFTILSFATLYGLIYALCTIITLIELITL